jgi:hypothetical protein
MMMMIKVCVGLGFSLMLFHVFSLTLGQPFAFFSYATCLLLFLFFQIFVLLPLKQVKQISLERLTFNLTQDGHSPKPLLPILSFKILLTAASVVGLLFFEWQQIPHEVWAESLDFFSSPKAFLVVKPPAFAKKTPLEFALTQNSQLISATADSLIDLRLDHTHHEKNWILLLQDMNNANTKDFFPLDSHLPAAELVGETLFQKYDSHPIHLTLTNGKISFYATLKLIPIARPQVLLSETAVQRSPDDNPTNTLAFSLRVYSPIKLTEITFLLKTKSGYEYEQIVKEFSNEDQTNFELPYAEVVTAGIPFQENDILSVKAVAKTPILQAKGESKEFFYPIQRAPKKERPKKGSNQKNKTTSFTPSQRDAMESQNQLDESWRKTILENILKLKQEDNPQNQPLIDYLESRLR